MPESVCEFKHTCAMMHRWRAEDIFRDSVLSIPLVFEAGSLLFPHVVCVRPAGLRASEQFPSCRRSAGLQMFPVTAGCFAWALEIHLRLLCLCHHYFCPLSHLVGRVFGVMNQHLISELALTM